uniref:Uncharacterized protein n=1 Tax=Branchiostoma floridae TaxID=7739 RepID=C3YHT2_BRAFL|eukprot:XP_002604058.1 hypothetical protein BRAFLDRAFT_71652 [Branchiostoma floridae]
MKNWKALGSRLPLAKETPRGHHAEVEVYNARLSTKQQEVEHVHAGDRNAPPTLPPRNLPPAKPEAADSGDKRSITTLGSWPLKQDNDDGRKNVSPTLGKCHSLETGGKEKMDGRNDELVRKCKDVNPAGEKIFALGSWPLKQTNELVDHENAPPTLPTRESHSLDTGGNENDQEDGNNDDLDRKYEDVDPAGDSIFAQSSSPPKQDDVDADGTNLPSPLPTKKSDNTDPCGDKTFVPSSQFQHGSSTELAPGHGTKMKGRTTEQPTDKVWKKYEDAELDSSGVDVVLGSGLKRAVPDLPPPRNRDIEEHSPGRRRKMAARSTEFSREKVLQRYEEVDLQSSGVDVVLGSGLKRAVPDLPPPRKRHIEVYNESKENKEDKVVGLEHGGNSVPSPRHFDMGDHRFVWSEHSDQSYCDTYFSPDCAYSIKPNKNPKHNYTETEVYNSSQEEKSEVLEDKNVKESSSGLRKQEMDVNNEEMGRKYEDVDPHGESIFALPSGLKSNEHSPRHLPKKDVHDSRPSSKKQHVEDVPAPLPDKKPSLRHHAMGGKEKEQLDGSGEEPNRKHEDTDPHGYGIFASSPETKKQCGEYTDGRDTPPPMPARNAHHLTMKDKEKDQKDEENRKYEYTDPHGYSIFASGPGSKKQCTEDTDGRNMPPPLPGRKYETVDPAGESIFGFAPGLKRTALGQHPTARPYPRQESRSDTSRTSRDTSRDGENDTPGFCDRVRGASRRGGVREMQADSDSETERASARSDCGGLWTEGKSSSLFWLLLGCGVVVTAAAVIAAVLGPRLMAVRTESISKTQFGAHLKHPGTPVLIMVSNNSTSHSSPFGSSSTGTFGDNHKGLKVEALPTTTVALPLNTDINECTRTRTPCQHGRCVNQDGGYTCTCSPGWTGQNCNQEIDDCTKNPCQHGHCVNQDGGYKCTCSPGWTGQNCQQARGFLGRHHAWIGLTRGPDGQFRWADGSILAYTNWSPGQPNNDQTLAFGKGEGCGVMHSKTGRSTSILFFWQDAVRRGEWNDQQCSHSLPFVCKRPK